MVSSHDFYRTKDTPSIHAKAKSSFIIQCTLHTIFYTRFFLCGKCFIVVNTHFTSTLGGHWQPFSATSWTFSSYNPRRLANLFCTENLFIILIISNSAVTRRCGHFVLYKFLSLPPLRTQIRVTYRLSYNTIWPFSEDVLTQKCPTKAPAPRGSDQQAADILLLTIRLHAHASRLWASTDLQVTRVWVH